VNDKEIRELNERLARYEYTDHPETIRVGDELVIAIVQKGNRDYFTEKPLYTNSVDSCLPLLEKLKVNCDFSFSNSFSFGARNFRIHKDGMSISGAFGETVAMAAAQAIDKAINELSKGEGE
jgi:hypothetical protein